MLLLARTTPVEQTRRRSEGLSVFLVDLREAIGHGLTVAADPDVMINNDTNELFFDEPANPGREPDRRGGARASATCSTA